MHKERILYVSDLDGTLLRPDETLSPFTVNTLNELIEEGMLFSYATARSIVTASKVMAGLNVRFPVIVYNGAFILDSHSGEIMLSNYFSAADVALIRELLTAAGLSPIIYAHIDGVEKLSFDSKRVSGGSGAFLQSRKDDIRKRVVGDDAALYVGEAIQFVCIDTAERLLPVYEALKGRCNCIFHRDIYSGEQWLEMLPLKATKANAVRQLKKHLQCTRVVAFGDGMNDIPMFQATDEAYAVANAADELKNVATEIIGRNTEDAVAGWLRERIRVV